MLLYDTDFNNIPESDSIIWDQLKEKEIVYHNGEPTIFRKSLYREYPKSVRHFLSLFPNNFIDAVDLVKSKNELKNILEEFENLLNDTSTSERDVLNFIKHKKAHFIVGSILKNNYSFGHHALYVFPEFQMPPSYKADYLLVGKNSDGYHFVFVELEKVHGDVTLKDGSFGDIVRKGISQIDDWEVWLEKYFSHLTVVFEVCKNKKEIIPNEFRDFDKTRVHYVVIAGRRVDYNDKTYRLRRTNLEQRKLFIIHYDNLIDYSNDTIGTSTF